MIARALRAVALLAIIGTVGCNRTTIVYPPPGSERPQAIPDPRCSPDWRRIAAGRTTVGELKAWADERERDRPCNGLRLLAHREAAVVDWRTSDQSVGDGEIVRQVLVEVDRTDPVGRPLRLHAMVGEGAGGAGPVTVLIEGPRGERGERGSDGESTRVEVPTTSDVAQVDTPPPNLPEENGVRDESGSDSNPETSGETNVVTDDATDDATDGETPGEPHDEGGSGNTIGESAGSTGTTTVLVSAAAGAGLTYALGSLGLLGAPAPIPPVSRGRSANLARRIDSDGGDDGELAETDAAETAGTDPLWDKRMRVRSAGFREGS